MAEGCLRGGQLAVCWLSFFAAAAAVRMGRDAPDGFVPRAPPWWWFSTLSKRCWTARERILGLYEFGLIYLFDPVVF